MNRQHENVADAVLLWSAVIAAGLLSITLSAVLVRAIWSLL